MRSTAGPLLPSLIVALCLFGLVQYAEGLKCYFTRNGTSDEKVLDCKDFYLVPTVEQMKKLKERDPNKYKTGKLVCYKKGFLKTCTFVESGRKMGCAKNVENTELESMLSQLANQTVTMLKEKECFCDTDRCNTGSAFSRPLFAVLTSILISLALAVGVNI